MTSSLRFAFCARPRAKRKTQNARTHREVTMDQIGVGVIGAGFVAGLHLEALSQIPAARVVGVSSPTPGHAEEMARQHHVLNHFTDYRAMLDRGDIQLVTLALPNYLHCQATLDAAAAGKHVVCEKPMALNL